eukprot:5617626-Lingulodinium_polyedra.AAC.1
MWRPAAHPLQGQRRGLFLWAGTLLFVPRALLGLQPFCPLENPLAQIDHRGRLPLVAAGTIATAAGPLA